MAILVEEVEPYLLEHVKGISQIVPDTEIPKSFRKAYLEARAEIQPEHIEEDLEAARVVSLYLANHYLRTSGPEWWKPTSGAGSPLIESLIQNYWEVGPFSQIESWVESLGRIQKLELTLELGCGVGGLSKRLKPYTQSYLGVDGSFASIALGRHLALGVSYPHPLKIPGDLLHGPLTRPVELEIPQAFDGSIDLVVGDLENPPFLQKEFDLTLALNTIDMLVEPESLPRIQAEMLKLNGIAIQSCPYIWHEAVAQDLRSKLPASIQNSAQAVEWLYQEAGFAVEQSRDHVPWLFFKHLRQLEIYSVHLFQGRKIS